MNAQCGCIAVAGCQRACQYAYPPIVNATADCAYRYSNQLVDNRADVYVTQPIINNRDHHIHHVNTVNVRDNAFYHYHQQNMVRDNCINHFYNRVVRQENNFVDYSASCCTLPGTVANVDEGTCLYQMPSVCSIGCGCAF